MLHCLSLPAVPHVTALEPKAFGGSRGLHSEPCNAQNPADTTCLSGGVVEGEYSCRAADRLLGLRDQFQQAQGNSVRVVSDAGLVFALEVRDNSSNRGRPLISLSVHSSVKVQAECSPVQVEVAAL